MQSRFKWTYTPQIEVCDDTDCDGTVDNVAGLGNACTVGVGACRSAGQRVCGANGLECSANAGGPQAEVCDGSDNDCDGTVDNVAGLGNACAVGVGACEAVGQRVCGADGLECSANAGAPQAEVCDGSDNNCDGTIDNVAGLGNACAVGVGACRSAGQRVCGANGLECSANAGAPQAEVCDGSDNDCDGTVDNVAGLGNACAVGVGACRSAGQRVCGGNGLECSANAGVPQAEVCDGSDNDCDGTTDEGIPAVGCYTGPPGSAGQGICQSGVQSCVNGGLLCMGETVPAVEECNGIDDDCDGLLDTASCGQNIANPGQALVLAGSIDAEDPLWSRPNHRCEANAGDYHYDFFYVTNQTGAAQALTITANWNQDGFLFVYSALFDPTDLGLCLAGDDDFMTVLGSQIVNQAIAPGETLTLVATSFDPETATGAYTLTVDTQ